MLASQRRTKTFIACVIPGQDSLLKSRGLASVAALPTSPVQQTFIALLAVAPPDPLGLAITEAQHLSRRHQGHPFCFHLLHYTQSGPFSLPHYPMFFHPAPP